MTRAFIAVRGFVQGVGYRRFAERRAAEFKLTGWVRNEDNGNVTCCVEGDRATVEQFIDRLKKGPAFSKVLEVNTTWEQPTGEFDRFSIAD